MYIYISEYDYEFYFKCAPATYASKFIVEWLLFFNFFP